MLNQFHLIDRSCYRRREEVAQVRAFFAANGWQEVDASASADVVVFFSCAGLRYLVDERLTEISSTQKKLKSGAQMIVGSCIPGMAGERLRDVFSGRTITPTDFSALDELPGIRLRSDNLPAIWGRAAAVRLPPRPGFLSGLAMRLDDLALDWRRFWTGRRPGHWKRRKVPLPKRRNTIAFSIVAGCSRRCAYCAKPFASGHIRSKPLETVIETIRGGLALGFRRFDLFADSIGLYGLDLHTPLGDLLERLLKLKRRFSVGLFDLHPQDFLKHFDAIRQLARAGKLHYLHVPIQSGNEDILAAMNRPIRISDLTDRLAEIRRIPGVFMQSGIIVGFPGETEAAFADTMRTLRRIDFDDVYVHYYCDMPNTQASCQSTRVPPAEMRRRLACVLDSGIRHNLAATSHEWERNLAYAESPAEKPPTGGPREPTR